MDYSQGKMKAWFFGVFFLFLVGSCGKDKEDSVGSNASALDGTWQTSCKVGPTKNGQSSSYRSILTVSGDSGNLDLIHYADGECKHLDWTARRTIDLTFGGSSSLFLDGGYAPEGSGTSEKQPVSYEVQSVFAIAYSDARLDEFNRGRSCDHQNWKKGEEVDISEKNCINMVGYERGYQLHTVFKFEKDKLYFGKTNGDKDGSSEEKRHSHLNKEEAFSRK